MPSLAKECCPNVCVCTCLEAAQWVGIIHSHYRNQGSEASDGNEPASAVWLSYAAQVARGTKKSGKCCTWLGCRVAMGVADQWHLESLKGWERVRERVWSRAWFGLAMGVTDQWNLSCVYRPWI